MSLRILEGEARPAFCAAEERQLDRAHPNLGSGYKRKLGLSAPGTANVSAVLEGGDFQVQDYDV
jgi:hypothetical protein